MPSTPSDTSSSSSSAFSADSVVLSKPVSDSDSNNTNNTNNTNNSKNTNNANNSKNSIQLLGQGGFGCVYYRGFDSNGIVLPPQYVTKVASLEKTQEIEVGHLISGLPGYEEFFTTVIETEPVDLAALAPGTLDQCGVIARRIMENRGTVPEFQLLTQLYVPHVTMLDFVKRRGIFMDDRGAGGSSVAAAYSVPRFMNVLISCHEHMLMALARMQTEAEVVHYDIKLQNVVLHAYTKNPVVLDFGLAFSIRDVRKALEPSSASDAETVLRLRPFFYGYYPDYMSWSVEVHIISYLVSAAAAAAGAAPVLTAEVLAELLNTFMDHHEYLRVQSDAFKRGYYERATRHYTRTAVGKPGLQLIRSYVDGDNWKRWDYYAVATLFLDAIQEMHDAYRPSEIEPYQNEISAFCTALKIAGDYIDRRD
jgi:hypothetical protein